MGSRWGEEEKKSKGIFGCLISFTVLVIFSYTFYINYMNLENRRKLEKSMNHIVESGYSKTPEEMISEILDVTEELGLPTSQDDISLDKYFDEYNNPVVNITIQYKFKVDLLITKYEASLPIHEDVTIVMF